MLALAEMRRVLRPGGLLLASSFGPETLQELRAAWAAVDDGVHVNRFVDVHDLGGALQRAGFIEPVLDVDRHVHHYADVRALMGELKSIGAHNVNAGRSRAHDRQVAVREAAGGVRTAARARRPARDLAGRVRGGLGARVAEPHEPGAAIRGETRIGIDALRASLGRDASR